MYKRYREYGDCGLVHAHELPALPRLQSFFTTSCSICLSSVTSAMIVSTARLFCQLAQPATALRQLQSKHDLHFGELGFFINRSGPSCHNRPLFSILFGSVFREKVIYTCLFFPKQYRYWTLFNVVRF
jgi:hypothetical protein